MWMYVAVIIPTYFMNIHLKHEFFPEKNWFDHTNRSKWIFYASVKSNLMLAENRKTVKPVGFTEFYVNQILLLHSQKPFFCYIFKYHYNIIIM